jgi:hypothetical protein
VKCEVKNVESAEVYQVPPEGTVFGRAGGPANITVPDQSVSKRHARIYLKDGAWVLEDLKSVNGTVVNNRRITEPMALQPGFVFTLSKHQFEIVVADAAASPMAARGSGPRTGNGNGAAAPAVSRSDPRRQPSAQRGPRASGTSQPVPAPDGAPLVPEPSSRQRSTEGGAAGAAQDAYLEKDEPRSGVGAVLGALPRAILYYLAAVPLMALNPWGTVRRGVEDPKLRAMGALELIAFILPVQLFGNLIISWATGIGTLIGGGGFALGAFFPVGGLVVAVVVAVVSGLITHPLLKLVIDRLFGGESTDTTRTNYVIMTQTAVALIMTPAALAAVLDPVIVRLSASLAPIALLLIIPALLTAIVTPLIPMILWQWMKAFRVAAIVQKLCFVLLILSLLGGLARAGGGIVAAVSRMTGGSPAVGIVKTDGTDAAKAAPDNAKLAMEEAKMTVPARDEVKAKPDDAKAKPDDAKAKPDEVKPPPVEARSDAEDAPRGNGSYATYRSKRDVVEKAIAEDPSLLANRKIGAAFRELSKKTYLGIAQAEEEVLGKKKKYDPALKLYLERYKEMKIYDASKDEVDALYRLLKK